MDCFSVTDVALLPHIVLFKHSRLANAFAVVLRFLSLHQRTLVFHTGKKMAEQAVVDESNNLFTQTDEQNTRLLIETKSLG